MSSLRFSLLSTSQRHSFFASCSFRLSCFVIFHVIFEKECYLRYHSFSLLLSPLYVHVWFWRGVFDCVFHLLLLTHTSISAVSLSLCRRGFGPSHPESSQILFIFRFYEKIPNSVTEVLPNVVPGNIQIC